MEKRRDSLYNAQTGLGDTSQHTLDTRTRTFRRPDTWRPVHFWNAEWLESPWARREVSQLTDDMVRKGVQIVGLPEWVDVAEVHERINADIDYHPDGSIARSPGYLHYIRKLGEQGDKAGGAVLLPLYEDHMDPMEPLDWRRIRTIDGWVVLDRSEVSPFSYTGTTSRPDFYVLSDVLATPDYKTGKRDPAQVGDDYLLQPGDVIHWTRLAFNYGVELSRREMRRRFWWGASVLENNMLARAGLEYGDAQLSTYIDRTVTMNFQIGGLNELQAQCDEHGTNIGKRDVEQKMRDAVQKSHGVGFITTDGGSPTVIYQTEGITQTLPGRNPDKIEQIMTPTDALVEINRYNRDQWQAGAGIPPSIAFGLAATPGLRGGKNEGDWQSWQGAVDTKQIWATYVLKWMLSLLFASKDGPSGGVPIDPNSYKVIWNPLLTPNPKEEAEIAKTWAEIDGIRQGQNVQRPDETRKHRVEDAELTGAVPAIEKPDDGDDLATSLVGIASNSLNIIKAFRAGEIAESDAVYLLQKQDPERFSDADEALGIIQEEQAQDDEPPDPISERFASMRGDLSSAKDIADAMTKATGLKWSPQKVHRVAKDEGLLLAGFGRLTGYPMQFFRELALSVAVDPSSE